MSSNNTSSGILWPMVPSRESFTARCTAFDELSLVLPYVYVFQVRCNRMLVPPQMML